MPNFNGPDGDLTQIFITEYEMVERYATTGSLWMWGYNNGGMLGDSTTVSKSSPVQTTALGTNWKQVACNSSHTAAVKTDGTLWAWGLGTSGQLGDNTAVSKSSPVQITGAATTWKSVSVGTTHTAAIKTDGSLWSWGYNYYAALGIGTQGSATNRSSPVQTVSAGFNWLKVVACNDTTLAIKTDGTLWGWGRGNLGQLGNNNTTQRNSPVQTGTNTNWKQISGSGTTVGAIKTDGTLWMWGAGTSGELGNETRTSVSSPVQTVAATTDWKQVSAGSQFAAAVKTDGTLWAWGLNNYGQLGDNTRDSKSSPVQIAGGGSNWKQAATGYRVAGAIKTDGTLWMWGIASQGGLGTNNATSRSSPVQTINGGTNWKQLAVAQYRAAATYFNDAGDLYPSK